MDIITVGFELNLKNLIDPKLLNSSVSLLEKRKTRMTDSNKIMIHVTSYLRRW